MAFLDGLYQRQWAWDSMRVDQSQPLCYDSISVSRFLICSLSLSRLYASIPIFFCALDLESIIRNQYRIFNFCRSNVE